MELERRMLYREVRIPGACWFCGQPDTRMNAWVCPGTIEVVQFLRQELVDWISRYWYCDRKTDRKVSKEAWEADYLVVWAMATATDGFGDDKLSIATQDSMGVQFLRRAEDASIQLHLYRCRYREERFKESYPQLSSIRQWLRALLETKASGDWKGGGDPEADREHDAPVRESVADGWETDEEKEAWEARLRSGPQLGDDDDSSNGDLEWLHCDDILAAEAP